MRFLALNINLEGLFMLLLLGFQCNRSFYVQILGVVYRLAFIKGREALCDFEFTLAYDIHIFRSFTFLVHDLVPIEDFLFKEVLQSAQ